MEVYIRKGIVFNTPKPSRLTILLATRAHYAEALKNSYRLGNNQAILFNQKRLRKISEEIAQIKQFDYFKEV